MYQFKISKKNIIFFLLISRHLGLKVSKTLKHILYGGHLVVKNFGIRCNLFSNKGCSLRLRVWPYHASSHFLLPTNSMYMR